jgi:hypothetical protein
MPISAAGAASVKGEEAVAAVIDEACRDFSAWLDSIPAWKPVPSNGRDTYGGLPLLSEADCKLHLVRFLLARRRLPPEWVHQDVALSGYLFPSASLPRLWCADIGLIDPGRLRLALTREESQGVLWNALVEVKFRALLPGFQFFASSQDVEAAARKLDGLRAFCDHAYLIVIDPFAPLPDAAIAEIETAAPSVAVRFLRGTRSVGPPFEGERRPSDSTRRAPR